MFFLSIHIPKTAGTSLAYFFDHGSGRKVLFDYDSRYRNFLFYDEIKKQSFINALPYIKSNFRMIHGHYCIEKYQYLIPDAKLVSCFRNPIHRTISQFKHEYYEDIKLENMDIIDFVTNTPEVLNAHLSHLSAINPKDLDFIFLFEDLDFGVHMFSSNFSEFFKLDIPPLEINTGSARENISNKSIVEVDKKQELKLFSLLTEEIEYYQKAKTEYFLRKKNFINTGKSR